MIGAGDCATSVIPAELWNNKRGDSQKSLSRRERERTAERQDRVREKRPCRYSLCLFLLLRRGNGEKGYREVVEKPLSFFFLCICIHTLRLKPGAKGEPTEVD